MRLAARANLSCLDEGYCRRTKLCQFSWWVVQVQLGAGRNGMTGFLQDCSRWRDGPCYLAGHHVTELSFTYYWIPSRLIGQIRV